MADAQDIDDRLKQMRAMHLMVEGIGPVSVAELADLGATVAQRYCRNDEATREPEPVPEALKPPISADAGAGQPDLDKVTEAVAEVEQQLDQVEEEDRLTQLEDRLSELETREADLAARTAAINSALERNDLKALAALVGFEQEEDDE